MAQIGGAARARGLGRLERLPVRTIVLTALSVGVLGAVAYGSYKTLTLPEGEAYSASAWRDFLVLGISQGAVYALIALGYTLVYGILRMINFAHGEVFMAGAFGSYFFADAWKDSGFMDSSPWLSVLLLVVIAMAVSVTVAVLLERIAYRPLRGAPRLVPLITAIGASLFLQNTFRGLFGSQTRGYPKPAALEGTWTILGIPVQKVQLVVFVVAAIAMVGLTLFVARTKTGKSMRAAAEDQEIASLMGINVDRVIVTTFVIGGMLAGIAGVLFALTFGNVSYFMGFAPGITAFTAAVLGGIGIIYGAAIGGLTIGILQSIGPPLLLTGIGVPSPFQLKDVVTFLILILVLLFRPGGLLGSGEAEKV
jgi:branched-chain amino acid transport system permease protein